MNPVRSIPPLRSYLAQGTNHFVKVFSWTLIHCFSTVNMAAAVGGHPGQRAKGQNEGSWWSEMSQWSEIDGAVLNFEADSRPGCCEECGAQVFCFKERKWQGRGLVRLLIRLSTNLRPPQQLRCSRFVSSPKYTTYRPMCCLGFILFSISSPGPSRYHSGFCLSNLLVYNRFSTSSEPPIPLPYCAL